MRVTVIHRLDNLSNILETVDIADKCPICGGERGKPWPYHFYEDGYTYTVDRWSNTCGHIDYYPNVLKEAFNAKTSPPKTKT